MLDGLSVEVRDETTAGQTTNELLLRLERDRLSVRELIRSRIHQEVSEYNAKASGLFRGLVEPSEAERELNGCRMPSRKRIDWEKQYEAAVSAFERSHLLVLVDDRQVESLDETVALEPTSSISFLRLVPLAGG